MRSYRDLMVPLPVAAEVAHELMAANQRLRTLACAAEAILPWVEPDLIADRLATFRQALDECRQHGDLEASD